MNKTDEHNIYIFPILLYNLDIVINLQKVKIFYISYLPETLESRTSLSPERYFSTNIH